MIARDRRGHQHVRDQQREVGDALLPGHLHGHRVGRRRGLEADAEEDDLLVGVLLGDPHRVQRASRRCARRRRALLTRNRSPSEPGTRIMSPNEQKMTSGRAAIASARSIVSSGVTHTGQPGPWISSTPSGSSWSMPLRMIVWVWPPQTSMSAHGPGDRRGDVVEQPAARAPGRRTRRGTSRRPARSGVGRWPARAPASSSPTLRNSSRVSSADASSSLVRAKPTWTIV